MPLLNPHEVILNRYEIMSFIDKGGFGEVYKAWDKHIERDVALKLVKDDKMRRELTGFQALLDITHKNVVRVLNVEKYRDSYYLIEYEFVEGKTLAQIMNERSLTLEEIIQIMSYLLEGLVEIEKVALHRDIKPHNIKLEDGSPQSLKILDLGIARVKSTPSDQAFSIYGTPGYTPPEVWAGRGDDTIDVFMTGVTFYQMITGHLPYGREKDLKMLNEDVAFEKLRKSRLTPPRIVYSFIEKAIKLDTADRFLSIEDMHIKFLTMKRRYFKQKDIYKNTDEKLFKFYDEFDKRLFEKGIDIESCTNLEYGLQIEISRDFVEAQINVYHGKKGFKVHPSKITSAPKQKLCQEAAEIACDIVNIPCPEISFQVSDDMSKENRFSRLTQIDDLLNSKLQNMNQEEIFVEKLKELDYGTMYSLTYKGNKLTLNVYYTEKKGFSIVLGGKYDPEVQEKIMKLLFEGKATTGNDVLEVPFQSWIGSDESGKGDYFGPLVAAGFWCDREIEKELVQFGIRDSKLLSDSTIIDISNKLYKNYKDRIVVCELPPQRYNEIYEKFKEKGKGLNSVLAWCHARVIEDLAINEGVEGALADQFGDEKFIRLQIEQNPKIKNAKKIELLQKTKAEKNIAVAAASIVARDRFIKRIKEYSQRFRIEIPKGAGADAIRVAKIIVNQYGREELEKYVKWHFKTTNEVLS